MEKLKAEILRGSSMRLCRRVWHIKTALLCTAVYWCLPMTAHGETLAEIETAAAAADMNIEEYSANAIVDAPGLEECARISQGGTCVIDGESREATFTLVKTTTGAAAYAQSQARAVGGMVLNVAEIISPGIVYDEAEVRFDIEGVLTGDRIVVYHCVKGEWKETEVLEVSDHSATVRMHEAGIYCFIRCNDAAAGQTAAHDMIIS